uniref:JmjC domain-containing protein n=1 Tax=Chlamydomonas leiostraca TaxID=1034604 RepID=A0A7S0S0S7_9CHLO|mmetsp:Transcript_37303/g.94067  ORF Transcript_37303/g.94067 Transcript_37303/m.94067 type:complete len:442 (+) Transcript_37303:108-1433(+)|eukprot:CAMPEP_0202884590 /NCGR_PEP_ID=MMETSP1391-20130828/41154_1 /ASSEMBLY_ACC=CAM_ASM_000867 /TAXON_ID=1034604 /ORGANISM="Chlamydomonas leiostraca, Strain SAG 11-49" /LENGTH=441 /DNA_ID=CAMNT_0049567807 /DNA_START=24 /DNA_END=1349 /DNA_ORIENTATION=-
MDAAKLLDVLKGLSHEVRDVDVGNHVDRVHIKDLTPLQFATQYVSKNKPVIIEGALDAWPAMRLWNDGYLIRAAGSQPITVDVTPNGRGDAVTHVTRHVPNPASKSGCCSEACDAAEEGSDAAASCSAPDGCSHRSQPAEISADQGADPDEAAPSTSYAPSDIRDLAAQGTQWFVTPCELKMTLEDFFDLFRSSRASEGATRVVPYVQHQNSSLTQEFAFLTKDIQPRISWADEVFGGSPDAVNLWIGDDRSVTSFHKDHYENLYGVVRGTKVFHLLPPSDIYRMALKRYPAANYVAVNDPGTVPDSHASTTGGASSGSEGQPKLDLGRTQLVPQLKEPAHEVAWSEVEVEGPGSTASTDTTPLFHDPELPQPLIAEVGPGSLLYLPSIWYHRVSQVCTQKKSGHDYVIAVNFWYDMQFDAKWAYFKTIEALALQLKLAEV